MSSRHGSVHSLNSPPTHPLLYTMGDIEMSGTQHSSLTNLDSIDRYDMYDQQPPSTGGSTSFGDTSAVRPKRKQVKNACSACQRACKRCDVGRPCERCIKYGMADSCRDSQRKERKKGIKRGPYKKRDGEYVPPGPDHTAHSSLGMINDLQRMSPKRMSRVGSIGAVDLSATNLIQIDVEPPPVQQQSQAVPGQMQPVPVRTTEQYPYQTPVMMSQNTHTPPLSLAGMHQQPHQPQRQQSHHTPNSNPQPSSSYHHSDDQYYQRYDQLAHGTSRSAHYRIDESCSQPSHHQDYSRHVQPIQDYTRSPMPVLQYPSPNHSPPRERQYANPVYHDNSSRHSMVQPVHQDHSYQSQSDQMPHDHESHNPRAVDSYYATHHQRGYPPEGHMSDVHQPQQDQQQQQSYYQSYNAYQQSSTSYGSSHSHSQQQQQHHQQQYGYSQNHVPQQQGMNQGQTDTSYSQHLNYSSTGSSSINTYPTQPHQQINSNGIQVQYPSMRSPMKMVHRGSIDATAGMVAHPHHSHHPQQHHTHHHHQHHSQHVGNVQVQSN
ncbi:unnamed protein product [Rhizoctonia solani]|uniref:Zn(2)-C6 fungal-type domain-containing protein n=1 Tax=Rhizoctonia solani TaxID=456999 RepID=A0A8H2XCY5_9AGAM|nr:unnamed protein product [Rhizoctonia solani]